MFLALATALASLAPFLGEWKCSETPLAENAPTTQWRLWVRPAPDGTWMETRYENDEGIHGVEYWGLDRA